MGLGEGVRWWIGEGDPGWGDRAPEGPSGFKTWWLLLINLVVTSNKRILAEGWGHLLQNSNRTWRKQKRKEREMARGGRKCKGGEKNRKERFQYTYIIFNIKTHSQ